ncbi:MAG TPA: amidohydrolase family protein, partial [Nitrospirales bacterium]|nr:amidohydrolase family protein [Nitrospirales bacterium]
PQTDAQALIEHLAWKHSDRLARRLGLTRRDFLRTTGGLALTLLSMNRIFGKFFDVTEIEAAEPAAFAERSGERFFIFDVQTHYVSTAYDPSGETNVIPREGLLRLRERAREQGWNPALAHDTHTMTDLRWDNFVKEVFLDSDTDLALISTPPGPYPQMAVVPPQEMAHIRDELNRVTGSQRMLAHGLATPQLGAADREFMAMQVETLKIDAWKCYTGFPAKGFSHGWWMDDERIAYPMLETARRLGVRRVCVHKGLPLGPEEEYNHPRDLIRAAKDFPDIDFLVYHSGLRRGAGIESVFRSSGDIPWTTEFCRLIGREPSIRNVHMEIGSSFAQLVLAQPEICAHFLGQLLKTFGPERVLWGTDSIWYGTPQWQIEAFRRFEIPADLRERHGYPPLTREVKERVFGLNAAKLFGVDPTAARQALPQDYLSRIRMSYREEGPVPSHRYYGWAVR